MKKYIICGAALLAALVSCNKLDNAQLPGQGREIKVAVSIDETTKTNYAYENGEYKVTWKDDETIYLQDATGRREAFTLDKTTLSEDRKSGVFVNASSQLADGPIYVAYNITAADGSRHIRQQNHNWGMASYDVMSATTTLDNGVVAGFALQHDIAILRITGMKLGNGVSGTVTDIVLDSPNICNIVVYNKDVKTFSLHGTDQDIKVNTVNATVAAGVVQKDIYIAFMPQKTGAAETYSLVFKVNDGGQTKEYTYEWKAAKKYEAGKLYTLKDKEIEEPEVDPATPITFADAAVKAICVAQWDTNKDGELSYAEAKAVTAWPYPSPFKDNSTVTLFNELQYFTGVSEFNWAAFRLTTSLTSVVLPKNLTVISDTAFQQSAITSIVVPEGVVDIAQCAFNYCPNLATVVLPSTVKTIGHWAFRNCYAVTSFKLLAPEPPTRADKTEFLNTSHKIYVPAASVAAYKEAWPDLAARIEAIQ